MRLLIFSIACFCLLSFSNGNSLSRSRIPPVRAVSLGGWLVTEEWIKPSLFDAIPNKDFMDGTQVQLKSVKVGRFLSADGGGGIRVSNRTASESATFRLWRIDQSNFNLRVFNKRFVGLNGIRVVAEANTPSRTETFQIHRNRHHQNRVRIKASNGYFLQVKTKRLVRADYKGDGGWGDNNPSVFSFTITGKMDGEYQVTNGYGPLLAPKVMKEHWSTFIVEKDFDFIKKSGLNAVRLPVGWWIAHDPNPPKPYVGGSLHFVDKAFSWAEKYGIKVILDLHAAPGSQNPWESRDGFQEWGQTDDTIQQTVDVIDFLTARAPKSQGRPCQEPKSIWNGSVERAICTHSIRTESNKVLQSQLRCCPKALFHGLFHYGQPVRTSRTKRVFRACKDDEKSSDRRPFLQSVFRYIH